MIVGLFLQQVVALFVLKSGAGFSIFNWIATLASDFLNQSQAGAAFFFDSATVAKHWFFVNTVCAILLGLGNDCSYAALALCHHLLHCLHPDDVLSGSDAVDYQGLVRATVFLPHAYL